MAPDGPDRLVLRHGQRGHRLGRAGRGRGRAWPTGTEGVSRPVIGLIGDGSSQYSVQALWTAAQHQLPIVYVVMRNNEYSILKSFAVLEETPGVPGLDLPGLGIAALARGWGCRAVDVETTEDLEQEFKIGPGRRHHDGHRGAHATAEGDAVMGRTT